MNHVYRHLGRMSQRWLLLVTLFPLVLGAVAVVPSTATGGPAHLVKEVSTDRDDTPSSSPHQFVAAGGATYFTANDTSHTRALWKTNGRADGTTFVADMQLGNEADDVTLVAFHDTLFFHRIDALWKSDGTAAGTTRVGPRGVYLDGTFAVLHARDVMLFFAYEDSARRVLWRTDGTDAGTFPIHTFTAGWQNNAPVEANNALFFQADGQLWTSDGTAAGTVLVKSVTPTQLTHIGTTIFFVNAADHRLWASDGTGAGTVQVAAATVQNDLVASNDHVFFAANDHLWSSTGTGAGTMQVDASATPIVPSTFVISNGTLFFVGQTGATRALWTSDGTATGTVVVKTTGAPASTSQIQELTPINGALFFVAVTDSGSTYTLWTSDATTAGTVLLVTLDNVANLANAQGALVFAGRDAAHGDELWTSDGTPAGTHLLKDIGVFRRGRIYDQHQEHENGQIFDVNGRVFFGAETPDGRVNLWTSDGRADTTQIVTDAGGMPASVNTAGAVSSTSTLFYTVYDDHGESIWKTDGSPGGTMRVTDVCPGYHDVHPDLKLVRAGAIYFGADDCSGGYAVWKSDGTTSGTVRLAVLCTQYCENGVGAATVMNDRVFFVGRDAVHGEALWTSDGTPSGTVLVKDPTPDGTYSSINNLIDMNGTLIFTEYRAPGMVAVWTSDGTSAGTHAIVTLPEHQDVADATLVDGNLLFLTGDELWKSDGTTAGTVRITNGLAVDGPLVALNDHLFFVTEGSAGANTLWRSDSTAAGTMRVLDANTGPANIANITAVPAQHTLLFSAYTIATGVELWQTDGTVSGTQLVQDIAPGPQSAAPHDITVSGTQVFFTADDYATGDELWVMPVTALHQSTLTPSVSPTLGTTTTPLPLTPTPTSDVTLIAESSTVGRTSNTGPITGALRASAPPGVALTFSIVTNGRKGTAQISTVRITHRSTRITAETIAQFTYIPLPDARGTDQFTFKVSDGTHESQVATVTVQITRTGLFLPFVQRS